MNIAGKIFYGWWIVSAAAVGLLFSKGPVIFFTFGVFFGPLGADLQWSRADISVALTLLMVTECLTLPVVGKMVDRYGARRVAAPSLFLLGTSVASLYFLTPNLWHLYAVFVLRRWEIAPSPGNQNATIPSANPRSRVAP